VLSLLKRLGLLVEVVDWRLVGLENDLNAAKNGQATYKR
jgi:hypothetical protein